MFGNHQRTRSKYPLPELTAQQSQERIVLPRCFPWRIQKNQIQFCCSALGNPLKKGRRRPLLHFGLIPDPQRKQVLPDGSHGGCRFFREPHVLRSAAQRFNPHGPRPGIQIRKPRPIDSRREHVEQRLPQPVARGTRRRTARRRQHPGTISSADHTHLPQYALPFARPCTPLRTIVVDMRRWSFQIGRIFGVEIRIHAFFVLLLFALFALSPVAGVGMFRSFALWLILLLAVLVRETARAIAAAWFGLELRGLLLLPTGGLMTFATVEATERAAEPRIQRRLGLVGPIASIAFGALIAAILLDTAPGVPLLERPWITPAHLLRGLVWLNLLLGVVNLLPAFPLDGGRIFTTAPASDNGEPSPRRGGLALGRGIGFGMGSLSAGLGQIIAIGLVLAGVMTGNNWLIILGPLILLGAHIENQGLLIQSDVDAVRMRDVMLTQFSTLSASDTLEDALHRSVHTLQDVFPVVRGGNLVGAVSRQNIIEALASQGNSYVQGIMSRSFQTAQPDDSLVKTLRRIMGDQTTQLVPVMEGERIVGIITPQNLSHSMGLLSQSRRLRQNNQS